MYHDSIEVTQVSGGFVVSWAGKPLSCFADDQSLLDALLQWTADRADMGHITEIPK